MTLGTNGRELSMAQLAALVQAAAAKVDPTIDKKLRTLAQVGVGYEKSAIQDVHAVATSTMLNSTVAESVDKYNILIGPTVFYAPYVALGTEYVDARPFHLMALAKLNVAADKFFTAEDLGL